MDKTVRNKPFLQQIAEVYAANEPESLAELCFVFPNKRSATFFSNYMEQAATGRSMPAVKTISSFVADFSPRHPADRYEQLFILYNEYRKLSDDIADFDQFLFWGEMLVSDFNDVDRYLVNPDALFVNVKRYKEIGSNYLTPEQIEIIRRYWGEEPQKADVDRFWTHVGGCCGDKGDRPGDKFLRLWEVLSPLYKAYHAYLESNGKIAAGMMYRKAAAAIAEYIAGGRLEFSRYIFVGFNVLTPAELKIFSLLRDNGSADFYWDFNSPAFAGGFNRAGRFIERNLKEFPSLYPLPEGRIDSMPDIEIIGVPSAVAQVKLAGSILREMVEKGQIDNPANAVDTAVVLPDESLFVPLRRSVPYDLIPETNVTMGLPMRLTSIAALMRLVVNLQLKVRVSGGVPTFFYEDVQALLANPSVRSVAPEEADALSSVIVSERLFRISAARIEETAPELSPLFCIIDENASADEICGYITCVVSMVSDGKDANEQKFLNAYSAAVNRLKDTCKRFGVEVRRSTFFRMVERTMASEKISLAGEPLKGLQIMGVLETRALDFDNIIMLSMNEAIFPRKHYSGSFIPDALRRGYGMATTDFQESIFAYYFYRLISRARRVRLIYDARSLGVKSGEMSRYLTQLLYLYSDKGNIRHTLRVFEPKTFPFSPVSIAKSPAIMDKLRRFMPGAEEPRNLSASAINTYIACPLQFYLRYVEGYDADDEMKDFIDASSYGSILHETAQTLYENLASENSSRTITAESLRRVLAHGNLTVDRIITSTTNKIYNRLDGDALMTPLCGEALVMGNLIRESICSMIEADLKIAPFVFEGAEVKIHSVLKVNDSLSVNFKMLIDRIDRVKGHLRIVDYKTGDEKNTVASLDKCFDFTMKEHPKGLTQILLYCHVYSLATGTDEPISPYIYNFRQITSKGPLPIIIGKKRVDDHREVMEEYTRELYARLSELFDPEVPFAQSPFDTPCKFCNFKPICGRES